MPILSHLARGAAARRLPCLLLAAGFALAGGPRDGAGQDELALARLDAPAPAAARSDPVAPLPRILSAADAARYRGLFAAQEEGDWARADSIVAALDDRLLMGHVLFQRYMHPTAYRSRFDELADWLRAYSDHPGAARVHRLARKRRPEGAETPPRPPSAVLAGRGEVGGAATAQLPTRDLGPADRKAAEELRRAVGRAVAQGEPSRAEALLAESPARGLLTEAEVDSLAALAARGHFSAGRDDDAWRLASAAADRSGAAVPEARWVAGLAAWRRGAAEDAALRFSALADSAGLPADLAAGGAYWAARAYAALGREAAAGRMLKLGAAHPRSIYGLLALRLLGAAPAFDWEPPRLGRQAARLLERNPAARRAMALAEAGNGAAADAELRALYPRVGAEATAALLVLAERLGLPGLQIRLGSQLALADGRRHDRARYPVPDWRPEGGFRVDRALLFALARRESVFEPAAKSRRGALGLMQIMPATARFVDPRSTYRGAAADALLAPERNMEVGQRYLDHLFGRDDVSDNLVFLLAAYNAGPTRLGGWRRRLDESDPMLFLESLPALETRIFVRRVLANLWIYRYRLGHPPESLDDMAAGRWPTYRAREYPDDAVELADAR